MRATLLKVFTSIPIVATVTTTTLATDAVRVEPFPAAPEITIQKSSADWSGVYIGGFGNYSAGAFDSSLGRIDANGYEGGVFAGYDFDIDGYVIGGEVDMAIGSVNADAIATDTNLEKRLNGSVRARAGIALDRVLIYGTAGLALTGTELTESDESDKTTHLGWTVGAGLDMKITERLFGRIEYRYTDYDSETFTLGSNAVASGFDEHSVRAGLGIRF
ncbi:MAG: outer membrane protein [Pseudomonadota bacterium]